MGNLRAGKPRRAMRVTPLTAGSAGTEEQIFKIFNPSPCLPAQSFICRQEEKSPNPASCQRDISRCYRECISMKTLRRIMDATDRMRTHGKQFKVTVKENTFQSLNCCQVRQHRRQKSQYGRKVTRF